jgi:hypothetical protein
MMNWWEYQPKAKPAKMDPEKGANPEVETAKRAM